MSYDLSLDSFSSEQALPNIVAALRVRVAASESLQRCENAFPSPEPCGDLRALDVGFENAEFAREDYVRFCRDNSLDAGSDTSAGLFLEHLYGRSLFVVYLPNDPPLVQEAFRELRDIAAEFSLVLHDPQLGNDIEPGYDGKLPPCF